MTRVDVTLAADVRAAIGAPGTGKSHYVKAQIAKARRLLVWDIEDEYSELTAVKLVDIIPMLHRKGGVGRFRFIGSADAAIRAAQFNLFCRIAFSIGNVVVVVEELRFVTLPSRAPEGWAMLTLRGRKRGIRVIGTTQRPASIDKDFLGQCNTIRVGALTYPDDRTAVARAIGCNPDEIAALRGFQAIEWHRPG